MENIMYLLDGFSTIMDWQCIVLCLCGILGGMIVGALPGMGADAGVAILLPICYGMKPLNALVMLCGLYYGAMFGGAITSILLNVPGTSAAVVTAWEGNKLAKKGRGGEALGVAATSSFIGGLAGTVALTLFAPQLAKYALKFGPAEMFLIMILAFLMISGVTEGSRAKSFASLAVGLLFSCVGLDSFSGSVRLAFGSIHLYDGISSVVAILGFFALTEILAKQGAATAEKQQTERKRLLPTAKEMKQRFPSITRGSVVGFLTGIMPGSGGTTATFFAYGVEKKFSKRSAEIGHGSIDAVAAAEAANNSCAAGAMIPMMSLSIPGSATTAVLLSGFIMFGLEPGPQLFAKESKLAWGIIASLYLALFILLFLNLYCVKYFLFLVEKATPFTGPLVASAMIAGVYSLNNATKDIWLLILCGVLGYVFNKLKYPMVPALLGLVLGRSVEKNLRRALTISHGSLLDFFTKPLCVVFIIIGIAIMIVPPIMSAIKKNKKT